MDEKKPLESRLLSHTSKEPEAQVWAQIGTKSYDPPLPSNDKVTKPQKDDSPLKKTPTKEKTENGTPEGSLEKEDTGNQDVQYFIDTGVEPAKSEGTEEKDASKPTESLPKSKSLALADGFENTPEETKETKEKKENNDAKEKSRSRSRSRERKRSKRSPNRKYIPDYTTNSNNPDDVKSRVFVGHLNTDACEKSEVEDLFKPYGKVLGITLQNGYGFVQYEDEKSVKDAIKHLHATMFHDRQLVVDRPVAMRKLEVSKHRERRDLLDELDYYRRRERDRRSRYDDIYDRPGRRDYYPSLPPPPLPPHYGSYMDRGDRYGSGEGMYNRYGEETRMRDDPYRDDRYRSDSGHYREDPYDYPRGNSYGDQYGKTFPRRM